MGNKSNSSRSIYPESKKKVLKINKKYFSIIPPHEHHLSMDHISENKSSMRSIDVLIDFKYPDELTVRVCEIAIHFYGRGWPSK